MKMLTRGLAAAALAVAGVSAQAAVVMSTPSFAGDVAISGFSVGGNTFTVEYTNLTGSLNFLALPDGNYEVLAKGRVQFEGCPASTGLPQCGPQVVDVPTLTPVYSGFLGSTGLTPGPYSFAFGTPIGVNVGFGFTLGYDGDASSQVMGLLAALGFPFVNPDGAGKLEVDGTFFADGTSAKLTFKESDLTWTGFTTLLALADIQFGGGNGTIDGTFSVRGAEVVANRIPEPATLALVGLGLLGAAAARRRRA